MSMTDPIADMLTRIRNASRARHREADIPASRIKIDILSVMKEERYILDFALKPDSSKGPGRIVTVRLRYLPDKKGAITVIKKISKPGLRKYVNRHDIPSVLNGFGTAILSTSKGIMTGRRASEARVGGEVICTIY